MDLNQQNQQIATEPPLQQPDASSKEKTIIAVLLLVFVYPLGLIFMWIWMKWSVWVKLLWTSFLVSILSFVVLTYFLLPNLGKFNGSFYNRPSSSDSERKTDLSVIQTAMEMYRADYSIYPEVLPACGEELKGSTGDVIYISKIPCDSSGEGYLYDRLNDTTYNLTACLDNSSDLQKDKENNSNYCKNNRWSYTVANP
jgi:hypothetical protein